MSDQSTPNTTADPLSQAQEDAEFAAARSPDTGTPVVRSPERRSIEGELISDGVDEPEPDAPVDPSPEAADPADPASSQAVLALGGGVDAGGVEIAGLHESQVSVLQEQHAKGLIEVQRKASELKVDIQALDQTLESLTSQARSANDAGVNITATHTQNTSLGQTEIIVGNTQRAAAGKVAPLWAGLDSGQMRLGLIVGAAVLAGVLLSALFG